MATRELRTLPSERAAPRVMRAAIVDRYGPREIVARSLMTKDVQLTEAAR
jgi:hypothetical protein